MAPHEPVEHTLVTIWQQVLGDRTQVGIHDNFFALGGDSILSMQMIARARQAGLDLTLKQFFRHQTIAQLARAAGSLGQAHPSRQEQAEVVGLVPLTPIQQWFFEQDLPQPQHFNQAVMLEIPPDWELWQFQQVVDSWLIQHDALRLRYEYTVTGWQQRLVSVEEAGSVAIEGIDLTEGEASDLAVANGQEQVNRGRRDSGLPLSVSLRVPISSMIEQVTNHVQASLDLKLGPLLRVILFDLGHGRTSRLLIVVHHLAIDGISWRVLLSDLQATMKGAVPSVVQETPVAQGTQATVPARTATASFQQWAQHLQELAQSVLLQKERAYWLKATQMPTVSLP